MLITIITLNGKMFQFEADEVDTIEDRYVFSCDGETVGSYWIKGIAGYYTQEYEDEDEED